MTAPKVGLQFPTLLPGRKPKLPQFFIVGAMKSGTSSLHWLLNQHPQIFLPDEEIHFFTIDDIEQNPDFFLKTRKGWANWDFQRCFLKYLQWYEGFFANAQPGQLLGEDCVSYMPSEKAPARIAATVPDAKLIFLLRDPVVRTYSHYWHNFKTNRATYDFEETLQFSPTTILQRSFYRQQIERYFQYFSPEQMKFIIFEDFIRRPQQIVDEVCSFLGLSETVDLSQFSDHRNKTVVPRNFHLQLFLNRFARTRTAGRKYLSYHLPGSDPENYPRLLSWLDRCFNRLPTSDPTNDSPLKRLLFTDQKRYPAMKPEVKAFLEDLFARENRGLSELIGTDVSEFWPYMQKVPAVSQSCINSEFPQPIFDRQLGLAG